MGISNASLTAALIGAFILGAGVASILWASNGPKKQPRDSRGKFVKA